MSHPYKRHAHHNDPKWLKGLQKYVEKAPDADVDDVVRNYGGNKAVTQDAAYDSKQEKS